MDLISLLWGFVSILIILIASLLLKLYFKDKDKRKLMYSLGLYLSSTSFIILAFGYYQNITENVIIYNIYRWGGYAYLILVFHATFELLYWRDKDLKNVFRSFLIFILLSFILLIANVITNDIYVLYMIVGTIVIIINCSGLILKYRDLSSHLFLFSVISSLIGAMVLSIIQNSNDSNWNYFSVFAFFISYAFLGLIFGAVSEREEKNQKGIGSYFSMKNNLADMKDALKLSEEKYKNIVELAPDGIVTVDLKGTVTSCNNAFSDLTGYSKNEIVGKHLTNLPTMRKRDIPKYMKLIKQLLKGGSQNVFEFEWLHKNGSVRNAEARASFLKQDNRTTGLQVIIRDTTDQKEAAEKLKAAHNKLRSMNLELENKVRERTYEIETLLKQKDEFINQLGHDLKNPLNPLVNLIPMLSKKTYSKKDKEIFDIVMKNVNYMKNLVIKTIELAKLNSPNTQFLYEDMNLLQEINKVIDSNKHLFDLKKIKTAIKVDKEIIVSIDSLRFEELMTNVLNNSIKYSKESGIVKIDAEAGDNFIKISVQDSGIGMDSKQLSRIFDEFYKADFSRHDFESSGLGMPICKRIVEKHGGRIWAESPGLGKGATIHFTLPNKKPKTFDNSLNYNKITKEIDRIIG